jgi:hypothetical protein
MVVLEWKERKFFEIHAAITEIFLLDLTILICLCRMRRQLDFAFGTLGLDFTRRRACFMLLMKEFGFLRFDCVPTSEIPLLLLIPKLHN